MTCQFISSIRLASAPSAAIDLSVSMNEYEPQSEDRSVSVGGDLVGSAIVTGDNNIVSVVYQTLTGQEAMEQADSLRNLQFLLAKVKTFWIGGVLNRAINEGAIHVEKLTQHQLVERPFEGRLPMTSAGKPQVVDRVSTSFDESGNTLLILGQPGTGKTMTLLELTRDLIERAENNADHPVPVVFLLSSWPGPEVPLDQWIEDELSTQYQIPRDIGHIWLKRRRLLPLLDGLDEVDSETQASCIEAIHGLLERVGVPGLAVSSRADEYENLLPTRLRLGGAICLQPLTEMQIQKFILDGRIKNADLRELLAQHLTLRQVVQTPLMFDIVSDVFDESTQVSQDRSFETETECRAFLFDAYLDRMLADEPEIDESTNQQFLSRLSWLGKRMSTNQQTLFQLEEIHPGWLPTERSRFLNSMIVGLVIGLLCGLVVMLASMGIGPVLDALTLFPSDHFLFLIQVPLWGLAIGLVDFCMSSPDPSHVDRSRSLKHGAIKTVYYFAIWMIWPLAVIYIASLSDGRTYKDWFAFNAMAGLITSSFFGSLSRNDRLTIDIPTVEALGISMKKALQGALIGGIFGMIVYWIYFCLVPTESFPMFWKDTVELYSFFAYPSCGAVVGLCVGGVVPRIDETKVAINQGIRLSRRNALITGLGTAVICTVPGFLMLILMRVLEIKDYSVVQCLWGGLGFGMLMGFFAGLWFGGLSVVKHYVLRWHLAMKGLLPLHVSGLLERASRLRLLRRVGGGYLFVHGLMRDYFASRD